MKITKRLFSVVFAMILLLLMVPMASAEGNVSITRVDEIPADAVLVTTDSDLTLAQRQAIDSFGKSSIPAASTTQTNRSVSPLAAYGRLALQKVVSYPLFQQSDGSFVYSSTLYITTYGNGSARQSVKRTSSQYNTAYFIDEIYLEQTGSIGTINFDSSGYMFYYVEYIGGYASGANYVYIFDGAGSQYQFDFNYVIGSTQAYDTIYFN